jgi:AcrR family transcriptional regulator
MSKEARRQLPNRAARRDDILAALAGAAACIVENGASFADLTVERLARQAGISRASFYLYFEDKAELVRAWNRDLDAQATETIASWWDTDEPSRGTVKSVLEELAVIHRENCTVLAAIQEISAYDHALREELFDSFEHKRDKLREHILRGQNEGWIVNALDPDTTAAWLVSMVERVLQQVVPLIEDHISLLDTGADIIWRSLYEAVG